MTFRDDDDQPSSSASEYFVSADHGKKRDLQKRVKEQLGSVGESKVQEQVIRSEVELSQLKQHLSNEEETEEQRKQSAEDLKKKDTGPKTRTLREEEEMMIETAQDHPSVDTMVQREQTSPSVDEEEVLSEGG